MITARNRWNDLTALPVAKSNAYTNQPTTIYMDFYQLIFENHHSTCNCGSTSNAAIISYFVVATQMYEMENFPTDILCSIGTSHNFSFSTLDGFL